jgi:hypothetical protein
VHVEFLRIPEFAARIMLRKDRDQNSSEGGGGLKSPHGNQAHKV